MFEELKNIVSLMKRMGENVSDKNFYLLFENVSLPVNINEGLIKSYDIEKVINFLSNAFGLERKDKQTIDINKLKNLQHHNPNTISKKIKENGCEVIVIHISKVFTEKNKIDYYLRKYGYFLSNEEDKYEYYELTYEKQFDENMTVFQLKQHIQYLYHVTDKKNVNNILKKGLKPKSKNNPSGFLNNERVYLYLNKPDKYEQMIVSSTEPIVLKIDLYKINPETKFYFDPRINNAFYTYEPIFSNAIQIENN